MDTEDHLQIVLLYNSESSTKRGTPLELIALQDTEIGAQHLYNALVNLGYCTQKIAVRDSLAELKSNLRLFSPKNTFVFNYCDGFGGENVQSTKIVRLLETMGFKHTGSAAETVALCIDKARSKRRLMKFGIPTPRFQLFDKPVNGSFHLNFPVIVKPALEDASMGIDLSSVVSNLIDLRTRVDYVNCSYCQPALVEEFIPGRELAVAMWGNGRVEALPITEEDYSQIEDPLQCLLTFEAKWLVESPYYHNITARCPAALSPEVESRCVEVAIQAYQNMGLRDFGRVDIRYYNQIPYVIDVNEIPDLSPDSGFPRSAMAAGYRYEEMVEKILDLSLRRVGWR